MRSPSGVLTSEPTMMVMSLGAVSRARSASSIRSWSVMARWVSPRLRGRAYDGAGSLSESKLRRV